MTPGTHHLVSTHALSFNLNYVATQISNAKLEQASTSLLH